MNDNVGIAILVGILATVQLHLAKALQRQGIETLERVRGRGAPAGAGGARKPLIYVAGLVLNNTIFVYPLIAQRYAPPAVYTSMFGLGLVFLMVYAARVLREPITRNQAAGSAAIVAGTLAVGFDNVLHRDYDRFDMALTPTLIFAGAFLLLGTAGLLLAARGGNQRWIGLVFGLFAGGCGSLDPFLKGVAQNLGGRPEWIPGSWLGLAVFLPSFAIGFAAFAVTQWGFLKGAPASVLVPAYNANYVLFPVLLQAVLLPSYHLSAWTGAGMVAIVAGVVLMRGLRR